jgi:hypothetical protein
MTDKKDHFSSIDKSTLANQVTNDKATIKTISDFIYDNIIQTNDTYNMPDIMVDNLYLNKNMTLNGKSTVNNEINFVTHNNDIVLDIFPRYSIIIYHNQNLPNRWVLCDGTKWWIHKTDVTVSPVNNRPVDDDDYDNYSQISTPDLRGRFIYGSNTTSFGDENSKENLGITSIDIDFNSSFAPMITIQFIDIKHPSAFITKIRTPCGQFTSESTCSGNLCGWDESNGKCRIQIKNSLKKETLFHRILSSLLENTKIRSMVLDGRSTPFFSTILYLELPHELIVTDMELPT